MSDALHYPPVVVYSLAERSTRNCGLAAARVKRTLLRLALTWCVDTSISGTSATASCLRGIAFVSGCDRNGAKGLDNGMV